MPTGTGLDAQFGTVTEAAVGTKLTVTKFWPFNNAGLTFDPSYIEGTAIQAGARFKDISLVGIARNSASGKIEIPVMMKGFGWWMKHLIGSSGGLSNPVVDGTLPYKQIHIPGGMKGLSFTTQVGKPEPGTGTVKPTTYNGCKVTDWSLDFADNAITVLSVSVDAWMEDGATALAVASYPTNNLAFNFAHVNNFTVGGAALTAAGETTITGGVAVPSVVTKLSIAGKNTLATDRYGLGNAGMKKEQLETDFVALTGSFEGEYDSTTWDSPFRLGTTVAIQVDSTGPLIEAAKPYLLSVIIPAAKITKAPAEVSGPDIISVKGEFTVYSDGVNPPIQVKIRSTDAVAW